MEAHVRFAKHTRVQGGYPEEWMASTFSHQTFGSGLVAIIAGLTASALAARFGSVAPFDASLVLLIVGGAIIWFRWKENYGEHGTTQSRAAAVFDISTAFDSFKKAGRLLVTNEKVLLLGLIQSCFESAMYVFVFMWTPALESSLAPTAPGAVDKPYLPHGVVFAIFMVCIMIGSKLFGLLVATRPVEHFTRWVFVLSSAALAVPIITQNHNINLAAFCLFEICCGIYFPSVGTMRSKYIPEEVRSTVMNIFRVGLNAIVVLTLINIDNMAQDTVFLFTVLLLTLAVVCQHRLFVLSEQNSPQEERAKAGLDPGEEMDAILASKADASA